MQRKPVEIHTDLIGMFSYFHDYLSGGNEITLCLEDDEIPFSTKDGAFKEFVMPSKVGGYDVRCVEGIKIPYCHTFRFKGGIPTINLEGTPKGQF